MSALSLLPLPPRPGLLTPLRDAGCSPSATSYSCACQRRAHQPAPRLQLLPAPPPALARATRRRARSTPTPTRRRRSRRPPTPVRCRAAVFAPRPTHPHPRPPPPHCGRPLCWRRLLCAACVGPLPSPEAARGGGAAAPPAARGRRGWSRRRRRQQRHASRRRQSLAMEPSRSFLGTFLQAGEPPAGRLPPASSRARSLPAAPLDAGYGSQRSDAHSTPPRTQLHPPAAPG